MRRLQYSDPVTVSDLNRQLAELRADDARLRSENVKLRTENAKLVEIFDHQITALPHPDDPSVWAVGITLPSGVYVGVACHDETLIPSAKAQVRARCAEIILP